MPILRFCRPGHPTPIAPKNVGDPEPQKFGPN